MSIQEAAVQPQPRGGVELRIPKREDVALVRIPRHAVQALRHHPEQFDEDVWTLLTSDKVSRELDAVALLLRVTKPFQDGDLFAPGEDLGPHHLWSSFEQQESVVRLDQRAFISPTGWVISPPFQLIGRGLIRNHCGIARPSVAHYSRARITRSFVDVPVVLTLRDPTENNYYHQFTDVLASRLRLAAEAGIPDDIPLLVAESVARHRNFEYVLAHTDLGKRRIILQPAGSFVRAEGVVIVQTPWFAKANFEFLQRWLSIPEGDKDSKRRLFVVREEESGRGLANMAAAEDLARRYGFEIVTTEQLPLPAQIELYSQARSVVSLWGSAQFNVVWRRNAPLSLLELFPPFVKNPDAYFLYLCRALGFDYSCYGESLGEPYEQPNSFAESRRHKLNKRVTFDIDVERVVPLIETMLDECG